MRSRLYRRDGFLSVGDCLAVRQAMDAGVVEHAEVLGPGFFEETDLRRAAIVEPASDMVERIEARLDELRVPVGGALGLSLGPREGAGFVRYPPGGFYKPHRDRAVNTAWPEAARRAAALVLFLNTSSDHGGSGEFAGGALRILLAGGDIDVIPQAGLLVAFPADVLHEVTAVRGGTRDTVVDWFYQI